MCIARDLALHGTQAKPFRGVIAGGFDAPVIEHNRLRPAAFHEKLSVIRTLGGGLQMAQGFFASKGCFKWSKGRVGHANLRKNSTN